MSLLSFKMSKHLKTYHLFLKSRLNQLRSLLPNSLYFHQPAKNYQDFNSELINCELLTVPFSTQPLKV